MAYIHKRKPKKMKIGGAALKIVESKGFGPEPEAGFDYSNNSSSYTAALNWYSRFMEADQAVEITLISMKTLGYTPKQISAAKRSGKIMLTVGSISNMLERGCTLSDESMAWYKAKLENAIQVGNNIQEQRIVENNVVNLQDRTANKAKEFIGDIDAYIDYVWTGSWEIEDFKPLEIFKELDVKPGHIKTLVEHYNRLKNDLSENLEGDCEGLTRSEKKDRVTSYNTSISIYDKLLEACVTWTRGNVVAKKPRKISEKARIKASAKAAKKEAVTISALKFKLNDNEMGLVSINPKNIIGSQILITYNTKYKILTKYVSKENETLGIKGTTILNYDETKSEAKRTSKAMVQIKALVGLPRMQASKMFGAIKATGVAIPSRTGEDTLLIMGAK